MAEETSQIGSENSNLRGFWRKVGAGVGRVPFLDEAVAAYYCARDPDTPASAKAILIGALAYFIVPADMVPDFIAGLGFTDDATVLLAALSSVTPHISAEHRQKGRAALSKLGSGSRPEGARRTTT